MKNRKRKTRTECSENCFSKEGFSVEARQVAGLEREREAEPTIHQHDTVLISTDTVVDRKSNVLSTPRLCTRPTSTQCQPANCEWSILAGALLTMLKYQHETALYCTFPLSTVPNSQTQGCSGTKTLWCC